MSFVFPKPGFRDSCVYSYSGSDYNQYSNHNFDFHPNHRTLFDNPEPDYDVLLFRLSLYAFNWLSAQDQHHFMEEIRHKLKAEDVFVLLDEQGPEESDDAFRLRTAAELIKNLRYGDKLQLFLSKAIRKFKSERQLGEFVSSIFKQLEADHQQQLIDDESKVYLVPKNHGEAEEDFRLRRFIQLCQDHTDYVYKFLTDYNINKSTCENDEEEEETSDDKQSSSDWKSCLTCFGDFFLGFSKIWFKGQSKRGQDLLIEQLSNGVTGVTINNGPPDESEEDFKLRKFTELCKKVADFKIQDRFLYFAESKLRRWESSLSSRLIGEPGDSCSNNELLSRLSALGFSLLSAKSQEHIIEELSSEVEGFVIEGRPAVKEEESINEVKIFTELFNQVSSSTRFEFFKGLKNILLHDEISLYEEFLVQAATTWFKARCAKYRRNPIHVILFGRVESVDNRDVIKKLPEESEEDFRLRRFTESFKRLRIHSRSLMDIIINYIQDDAIGFKSDISHITLSSQSQRSEGRGPFDSELFVMEKSQSQRSEGRGPFDSEWIVMEEIPRSGDQGAAANRTRRAAVTSTGGAVGSATTTRAGEGTEQGTNRP